MQSCRNPACRQRASSLNSDRPAESRKAGKRCLPAFFTSDGSSLIRRAQPFQTRPNTSAAASCSRVAPEAALALPKKRSKSSADICTSSAVERRRSARRRRSQHPFGGPASTWRRSRAALLSDIAISSQYAPSIPCKFYDIKIAIGPFGLARSRIKQNG